MLLKRLLEVHCIVQEVLPQSDCTNNRSPQYSALCSVDVSSIPARRDVATWRPAKAFRLCELFPYQICLNGVATANIIDALATYLLNCERKFQKLRILG